MFDVGVSGSNENDGVIHYLDKNLKEVAKPSDSLLRNFDTDTTKYETFVEQLRQTDIYGRTEHKVGIRDKEGKIIIPAEYDELHIGENGVAVALLYFESAESYVWEYRYGEGLSIYGYIDLTTGKSTFTDADFAKMEGYRQAQEEAYPGLKQQKEAEEQERRREEEIQQHPEIKFNEMLSDYAWHAYGYWSSTPMEYIVTFRPKNKYSGSATYVRWINDGKRNEYSGRGTSDYYKYIIRGNILEVEWDSFNDGLLKYEFAIEYSDGEIILLDTKFSNRKYRPISKTRELVPSDLKL